MKIEYTIEQKPIIATTKEQAKWKLVLNAEGTYDEIYWFKKQLDKISNEEI